MLVEGAETVDRSIFNSHLVPVPSTLKVLEPRQDIDRRNQTLILSCWHDIWRENRDFWRFIKLPAIILVLFYQRISIHRMGSIFSIVENFLEINIGTFYVVEKKMRSKIQRDLKNSSVFYQIIQRFFLKLENFTMKFSKSKIFWR